MEKKPRVPSTWKLFLVGCFCGGLLSILFIDRTQQNLSLLSANNAMQKLNPFVKILDPTISTPSTEQSKLTIPSVDVPPPITTTIFEQPSLMPPTVPPEVPPLIISPISESNFISPIFEPNYTDVIDNKVNNTMNNIPKIKRKECDIFDGRWVYKADNKPSYNAMTCPFLEVGVRCQANGRSDFDYENWRWEARKCDIPLFDGKYMLERVRNKRMIIVGDSINRNMWESLACLLYSSVPSSRIEASNINSAHRFLKAKDYNFIVEFFMSPFLIELDKKHKSGQKVLILDSISPFAKMWRGADIMVFNSGHWWTHNDNIKAWELFQYQGNLTEEIPREIAFKRAMRTWSSWIKKNVDPKKTSVYFRSVSPTHEARKYDQWCYNVTQPMLDDSYVMGFPQALINVVENTIKKMSKLQVKYLNITKLSQYRIDAHPSFYTEKLEGKLPGRPDCSHWCLPGLPDTWNRLLYTSILFDRTTL